MRVLHIPGLVLGLALAGCSSFDGMPDPVLTVAATDQMLEGMTVRKSLDDLATIEDETNRKPFRNKVIASFLAASDARYLGFLRSLSRQSKGTNFGLDIAALGLSSISAIASGAANELATGAAIATGARGSLNKEVYFDKAMPAIISSMEARRLVVRAQIEDRMKLDTASYTLEQGFADVMRYQMATTLDGAIQEITSAAGEQEKAAQERYKDAVDACDPATGLEDLWGDVNVRLRTLAKPNDPPNELMVDVGTKLGVAAKSTTTAQVDAIMDALERACSTEKTQSIIARLPAEES